jgi:methionine synthase I (cobalamin-dependent)
VANRLRTLLAGRPALFDGGYGWLLQERALAPGECVESLNLTDPERVGMLHEQYAAAGATIISTNTFGANGARLAAYGLSGRVEEVNRAGAAIARGVADRHGVLVAGATGPTGELLEPLGTLSREMAVELYAEQIHWLAKEGVDLVLVETMSDLGEARAAVAAARRAAPDLPVVATFSFDTNLHTMMGVSPRDAVLSLTAEGVDGVGANCGNGPEEMAAVAEQLVAARDAEQLVAARDTDVVLVAQSNAGLPELDGDRFVYPAGPEVMAAHAVVLHDLGVDVVGACCGSTPEHVRAMAAALADA